MLLGGAKLSGLILELLSDGDRLAVSLGVGVNLAYAPRLPNRRTAALAEATLAPDPDAFLMRLEENLTGRLDRYAREGLGPIRAAWLVHAGGVGEPITARLPNETVSGVFGGLDARGALLLRTREGLRTITAGDVFFPGEGA